MTPGIAEREVDEVLDRDGAAERARAAGASVRRPPLVVLVGAAAGGPGAAHLLHAADAAEQAVDRARLDLARACRRRRGRSPSRCRARSGSRAPCAPSPNSTVTPPSAPSRTANASAGPAPYRVGSSSQRTPSTRRTWLGTGLPAVVEVVGDRRVGDREALAGLRRVAAAEHGARGRAVADAEQVRARGRLARARRRARRRRGRRSARAACRLDRLPPARRRSTQASTSQSARRSSSVSDGDPLGRAASGAGIETQLRGARRRRSPGSCSGARPRGGRARRP